MGKVLKEYPSSSNPAKSYHVIRGDDGVTYCSCPGWRFNVARDCKHLRDYLANQKAYKVIKRGTDTILNAIQDAVEEAVRNLS